MIRTELLSAVAESCRAAEIIKKTAADLEGAATMVSDDEKVRLAFHLREIFERMGSIQYDILRVFEDRWKDTPGVVELRPKFDNLSSPGLALELFQMILWVLDSANIVEDGSTVRLAVDAGHWKRIVDKAKFMRLRTGLHASPT